MAVSSSPETISGGVLFDASPLPTFVIDADTLQVLAANAAAHERYGYSADAMKQLTLTDLTDASETARPIATREVSDGVRLLIERHRHRRRDGTVFPVHCASREFRLRDKRLLILVVTELSELRVLDSEQRFVDKMEAMSRLGGGIAHTFNNLLTGILATTDLALESALLAPSMREDLQKIRESAQRAAAITRQLMAFSGSQSMSLRQTDVNQLLQQLSPLLQNVIPRNTKLALDLRSTGFVKVDPAHLEQMVLNLALNAVEAMPHGGTLTVTTEDANAFVSIVVADSGKGMDEMMLARLFEPFQSSKGPTGARGLGLAAVWGTVRQMGGSIEIESGQAGGGRVPSEAGRVEAGGGSCVRMYFPRVETPIAMEFVAAPSTADVTGGEVVLVVEDEPSVRAPICRMLRTLGYFVLEADNGEEALKTMQEYHSPVHLVISDVMMPEMDGTELVGHLRDWYPRMRVLFISGYSAQYLESRGEIVSGSSFLAKPFTMDALRARIRELLDSEWTGEPEPA